MPEATELVNGRATGALRLPGPHLYCHLTWGRLKGVTTPASHRSFWSPWGPRPDNLLQELSPKSETRRPFYFPGHVSSDSEVGPGPILDPRSPETSNEKKTQAGP